MVNYEMFQGQAIIIKVKGLTFYHVIVFILLEMSSNITYTWYLRKEVNKRVLLLTKSNSHLEQKQVPGILTKTGL